MPQNVALTHNATLARLMSIINAEVVNPILALMFVGGLLVFIWGLVEMLLTANQIGEYKTDIEAGKRHMWWGMIGMFVMAASWAILRTIAGIVCNGGLNNCGGAATGTIF